jgi:hypothetical protein
MEVYEIRCLGRIVSRLPAHGERVQAGESEIELENDCYGGNEEALSLFQLAR